MSWLATSYPKHSWTTQYFSRCTPHHTPLPNLSTLEVLKSMYNINEGVERGTATRYGLDGPGIESQWRWDFSYPSKQTLGPTLYNEYRVSFPEIKRKERGVDRPPNLTSRFKKEWKYTTTPPLGVYGQFCGKLYFLP
jgi:hypothetical protein